MDDSNSNVGDRTELPANKVESVGGLQSEQHMTPAPRVSGLLVVKGMDDKFHYSHQYHWTVRKRVTEMTSRTAAILLKVWIVEAILNGISFTDYLGLEYLVSYVLGGKTSFLEIRDEKDRQAVMLGELLLSSVRGDWFQLGEAYKLPPQIQMEMIQTGWLPTKRTWASWKSYHEPWKFLEVLAVPLDTYDERDKSTTRYSGYTKHYGNGGHISRTLKTPYDSELDGESTDREPPEFSLQEIDKYNHILLSLEREKRLRKFEEK